MADSYLMGLVSLTPNWTPLRVDDLSIGDKLIWNTSLQADGGHGTVTRVDKSNKCGGFGSGGVYIDGFSPRDQDWLNNQYCRVRVLRSTS